MMHNAMVVQSLKINLQTQKLFIEHTPIHSNSQKLGELQHFPQLPVYWLSLSHWPVKIWSGTKQPYTVQTPVWREKTDAAAAAAAMGQRTVNRIAMLDNEYLV